MTEHEKKPTATECEEWFYLSLAEVTSSFGVSKETVIEIVNEGIIPAQKDEHDEWQFDSEAVRCIRTVLRLNRDLGVNLAGAALALELLKEIDRLHAMLRNKGMA
ncbi:MULTISPECIES: chaperone modulator CbpM [Legionella]|uniref:Putative chaperone-modulator protein CbpM n=1 Tax=Legionella maceachernii TaxID=466 RepID=A0A0W0WIJ8_9GAMM|nr:chaperone modulator CbpM [Legionella maceachernii]KTD31862.1 putative chaperone-modulator protein CbpM [Legionella maceachernii]SJZ43845.1 chaperone modulatory protein CbpM [Legionella maceachernii]SUP04201.1 Chaperone modulatory protein CbpM [Legionella maceachernii]